MLTGFRGWGGGVDSYSYSDSPASPMSTKLAKTCSGTWKVLRHHCSSRSDGSSMYSTYRRSHGEQSRWLPVVTGYASSVQDRIGASTKPLGLAILTSRITGRRRRFAIIPWRMRRQICATMCNHHVDVDAVRPRSLKLQLPVGLFRKRPP